VEPVGYAELLEQVKVRVRTSRVQAARAVNTELVGLYWQIGRLILGRQESEGWGTKVIGRLAADLRAEFPGMRGLPSAAWSTCGPSPRHSMNHLRNSLLRKCPGATSWCYWIRSPTTRP